MNILVNLPELLLAHYCCHDAYALGDLLTPISPSAVEWEARLDTPRFHVVTASQYGRVVGYIAVDATDAIEIVDLAISRFAESREDVLAALVDAGLDVADNAWGNVDIDCACEALPHLLETGWAPVARNPHVASTRLQLTGAGVL